MTLNEAIKFVALHLFFLLYIIPLQAQGPQKVLATTITKMSYEYSKLSAKPIKPLISISTTYMPIVRVPEHFLKHYLIRVDQTDNRRFLQDKNDPMIGLYFSRGIEHDGYEYYLPVAFSKEEQALNYLQKMDSKFSAQAVVVKHALRKAKCHCFGKF